MIVLFYISCLIFSMTYAVSKLYFENKNHQELMDQLDMIRMDIDNLHYAKKIVINKQDEFAQVFDNRKEVK